VLVTFAKDNAHCKGIGSQGFAPPNFGRPLLNCRAKAVVNVLSLAHWTYEEWSNIAFSDESTVQQFCVTSPYSHDERPTMWWLLHCCNCKKTPKTIGTWKNVGIWNGWV